MRCPGKAQWLLLLAHGAGAGMEHAFMESISVALFELDIATFRYQFPYRERGKRFSGLPEDPIGNS